MDFSREINRLLIGVLLAFLLIGIAATYWALVGQEGILNREDNPRRVEVEAAILRGGFYDRSLTLLAQSVTDSNRRATRTYLYPEMNSALGYFSLRYGVGGAESAFNALLRGDTRPKDLAAHVEQGALHRPQRGIDVQLTLSLEIQRSLIAALGNHTGAAIVMSVPDGEILAMASLPTFNPNTLDADWDTLTQAAGKPFFNRALQGVYQPGGVLQTPLIAAALLTNRPLNTLTADATAPVTVGVSRLTCTSTPPRDDFDYKTAYAYGCPRPFALLTQSLGEKTTQDIFTAFRLSQPPELTGFVVQAQPNADATAEATAEATAALTPAPSFVDNALGQGQQTVNPIGMASIVAAIVNEGNAPLPYAILATRDPESTVWQNARPTLVPAPLITAPVARQMNELMLNNVTLGAIGNVTQLEHAIGGHSAIAYSGDGTQTWFIGFVHLEDNRSVVIAVVLEDSANPADAAAIGSSVLISAYDVLQ